MAELKAIRMSIPKRIQSLVLLNVAYFLVLFFTSTSRVNPQNNTEQPFTTPKELVEAANLILSDSIEFEKRVTTAKKLILWLDKTGSDKQKEFARNLCLRFYSTLVSELDVNDVPSKTPKLDAQTQAFAEALQQGKYNSTGKSIQQYIEQTDDFNLHPALSILSLKALKDTEGYRTFFVDLQKKRVSAYSLYFLGIMHAREMHFVEAETFLQKAKEHLQSDILLHCLNIDLVKLFLRKEAFERVNTLLETMLQENPKDAEAIYWKAQYLQNTGQKDAALQELYRLRPLLYADPHLVSAAAQLAYLLNQNEEALKIMNAFESKVEPNWQFYKTKAYLLRRIQNQPQLVEEYETKARQLEDTRVTSGMPPTKEIQELLRQKREKQRQNLAGMEGLDPFNRIYIALLDEDVSSAIGELQSMVKQPNASALEYYLLGMIERRSVRIYDALETFQQLRLKFPDFQQYKILYLQADLAVRTGKHNLAKQLYSDLLKRFPESSQAQTAQRYLNDNSEEKSTFRKELHVSPFFSRFPTYSAPYVLSELVQYWGDSRFGGGSATFASIRRQLNTDKFRGLGFDQMLAHLQLGTLRYKIEPFVGEESVVLEYLKQRIPVIHINGSLYADQSISDLLLLSGYDSKRGVFYGEGATTYDTRLLTENELLEGICIGVYPESGGETFSKRARQSQEAGLLFVNLASSNFQSSDETKQMQFFEQKKEFIMNATDSIYIPHQLAYNRWIRVEESAQQARKHLNSIQKNSSRTAQYWFLSAMISYKENKTDESLAALDKALLKQPGNSLFEVFEVIILREAGRLQEALALAENLRYQYPEDPLISFELLKLYKESDQFKEYYQEEARIKKLFGSEFEIHFDPMNPSGETVSHNPASQAG